MKPELGQEVALTRDFPAEGARTGNLATTTEYLAPYV